MDEYTGANTGDAPLTLILLNKQRMDAAYTITETAEMVDKLRELADAPDVRGLIVPVENTITVTNAYAAWDAGFACEPEMANMVADAIKDVATGYLDTYPSIQYIVIVGDDLMMPFRRVPDDAQIANEADYAPWSGLAYDNPTRAALEQGYILSDDFYADSTPLLWRGRELYVPDLPIGRLVETPQEIGTVIDTFLERGGLLAPDMALVTGYDFLIDGAEAISNALGTGGLTPATLIDDEWDAAQLEAYWLDVRQDVASINAHFDHRQAFPATGSASVYASDVLAATASLSGTLNFSMGCHGGFSVPDEHAWPGYELDFAQALARRGGWWVGNTGFGYGMDDSVAFTEQVMHLLAQELAGEAGISVGEALRRAKQNYVGGVPSGGFGTYDEKALIEAALYGLPMYRMGVATVGAASEPQPTVSSQQSAGSSNVDVQATGLIVKSVSITPTLELSPPAADGRYYTADGGAQVSPGRPVQPRTSVALPEFSGMKPHDALFLSGRTTSDAHFDPLISRPVTDTTLSEPDYDYDGWYPLKTFTVNRLGDPARLVVLPAQYSGDEKSGVEKVFEQIVFAVYYAEEGQEDLVAPALWEVESEMHEEKITFRVLVQDDSGVERVVVTHSDDGQQWQSDDLTYSTLSGYWEGELDLNGGTVEYFVQAVDKAGNVSMSANKGLFFGEKCNVYLPLVVRNYTFEPHDIYLPLVMRDSP